MPPLSLRAFAGAATCLAALATAGSAQAYNYVQTANGEAWGVQDGAAPRVDTGSIRDTTSGSLRGFGGIRVRTSTNPLRNGELVRGFNLRFDPPERFTTTTSVDLGGVSIARAVRFNRTQNWGRWVDTFENTTGAPIDVDVAFGGQTGIGNASGSTNAAITDTSSGDAVAGPEDAWTLSRFGTAPAASGNGPSAVVVGTPDPFAGALGRTANFVRDPFTLAPTAVGHEANFVGYQHSFTLAPGEVKVLARFVVIGTSETTATAGTQVTAVRNQAVALARTPSFADLTKEELCAIDNWDVAAATAPVPGTPPAQPTDPAIGFDAATDCPTAAQPVLPPLGAKTPTTTGAKYDVVGKTIQQLKADMASGATSSREITRAYLDRIAAYDKGAFGFNSFTTVADDALAQADAADARRAKGESTPVLGVPLAIKDLYDTKDMPTTNGSLVFEGYRPPRDATQVAKLREAGAVILGKASLEEYALSGQYSDSAYGQVWNAFQPSKSSLASSGGTAVATAASLAAGGLGSQTGDSLYAPASAASLYTLRGTDGLASSAGVMPLSYLQDYAGAITRSLPDLADVLNVTTGTDPRDPTTVEIDADARRPADWNTSLRPDALQGKRIGYYASAFVDPFGTTGTVNAQLAALQSFAAAGATLVQIDTFPNLPANSAGGARDFQGWKLYIEDHPNLPYNDPRQILANPKRLPYRRSFNGYTGAGPMSDAQVAQYKQFRADAKVAVAGFLDNPGNPRIPGTATPSPGAVDAVVFPGLRSDISLNDGGGNAFGRGDPPTNSAGAPSVAFPAGVNDHGEPMNLQLVGRAYDDAKLMGYAFAYDAVKLGHVETDKAPALPYVADPTPPVITAPAPVAPAAALPLPPVPSKLALQLSATTGARQLLSTVRAKGLALRFTVNQPAVLKGELRIPATTARRLGIPTIVGKAERGFLRAGSATVRVRLTQRAAKALRRSSSVALSVRASATTVDGRSARTTKAAVLRR